MQKLPAIVCYEVLQKNYNFSLSSCFAYKFAFFANRQLKDVVSFSLIV